MQYTKTAFNNGGSPAINATWLNALGTTLEAFAASGLNRAVAAGDSTATNYKLTIGNYTSAPASGHLPILLNMLVPVTNSTPLYVTPSWGSTQYPVWDTNRSGAVVAGELVAGLPVAMAFDGTKFWVNGHSRFLKFALSDGTEGYWDRVNSRASGTSPIRWNGYFYTNKGFGSVWNDYAELRRSRDTLTPGCVVVENGDDSVRRSTKRMEPGAMIISDTYGWLIGEQSKMSVPIAVSGRVLAYTDADRNTFEIGAAVCSGENGTVSMMQRDEIITYPERIIGTVSAIPDYEFWGADSVAVDNRIWIKVK